MSQETNPEEEARIDAVIAALHPEAPNGTAAEIAALASDVERDDDPREAEDASRLRQALAASGPLKLGEVDAALREARETLARYENRFPQPESSSRLDKHIIRSSNVRGRMREE